MVTGDRARCALSSAGMLRPAPAPLACRATASPPPVPGRGGSQP
jgi:hypothetical protein